MAESGSLNIWFTYLLLCFHSRVFAAKDEHQDVISKAHRGCYGDGETYPNFATQISDGNLQSSSVANCIIACRQRSFPYAGLKRGQACYCAQVYDTGFGKSSDCRFFCGGECGGASDRLVSVYETRKIDAPSKPGEEARVERLRQGCTDGKFAPPGCQERCHCYGGAPCDPETGSCGDVACSRYYHGEYCQKELPYLVDAPSVTQMNLSALEVRWRPWREGHDGGAWDSIHTASYILDVREVTSNLGNWNSIDKVGANATLTVNREQLFVRNVFSPYEVGQHFQFRVRVMTQKKGKPSEPAEITIECPPPSKPLSRPDVGAEAKGENVTRLSVSWQGPVEGPAECRRVAEYRLYVAGSPRRSLPADTLSVEWMLSGATAGSVVTASVAYVSAGDGGGGGEESPRSERASVTLPTWSPPVGHVVQQLRVTSVNATALGVAWERPAELGGAGVGGEDEEEEYEVTYRRVTYLAVGCQDGGAPANQTFMTRDATAILNNLEAYSKYMIAVRLVDQPSSSVIYNSTGDSKAAPPRNIELRNSTNSALHFVWEAPPCEERRGKFRDYEFVLRPADSSNEVAAMGTVNMHGKIFKSLSEDTDYEFRVNYRLEKADGSFEASNWSELFLASTKRQGLSAPQELKVMAEMSESIALSWTPPPGNVESYSIRFSSPRVTEGYRTSIPHSVYAKSSLYFVQDLEPNTDYQFQVRAHYSTAESPWSESVEARTKQEKPGPPQDLNIPDKGETWALVSWIPPFSPGGTLRDYLLKVEAQQSYNPAVTLTGPARLMSIDTAIRMFTITDLQPGTMYKVTVAARSTAGRGAESDIVFWTDIMEPLKPLPPVVQANDAKAGTITVLLSPTQFNGPDNGYYVVVSRATAPPIMRASQLQDFATARKQELRYYVAAQLSEDELRAPTSFVVGDAAVRGGYYNARLDAGAECVVYLVAYSNWEGETKIQVAGTAKTVMAGRYEASPSSSTSNTPAVVAAIVVVAFLIIIAIIVVAFFVFRRKAREAKKQYKAAHMNGTYSSPQSTNETKVLMVDDSLNNARPSEEIAMSDIYENVQENMVTRPIAVGALLGYVHEKKATNGLEEEYKMLPTGMIAAYDVARQPTNKSRNRFGNVFPYDQTRVILKPVVEMDYTPPSDYINASYIDGYERPKMYIATQGPKDTTLEDFWIMMWQEPTTKVIMVTNCVEEGRIKCEKYCPDLGVEEYGKMQVKHLGTETLADYTIRTLELKPIESETAKTIKQYHFTSWPDHGVPQYPTALLSFRRKVRSDVDCNNEITVVHCSAGVGRTGTYIALDSLLEQAKAEDQIDLLGFVWNMRQKRTTMIQTLEQYVFLYDALVEALQCGDTVIPTSEFHRRYHQMCQPAPEAAGRSEIEKQFEMLQMVSPVLQEDMCKEAHDPKNVDKNRCLTIVPADISIPFLITFDDTKGTSYINATFVDGYKQRNGFIVTQTPLAHTVNDFWSLMRDHGSLTIINLDTMEDETCCQYWPNEEGVEQEYGHFSVRLVVQTGYGNYITARQLQLTQKDSRLPPRLITQFDFRAWPSDREVPANPQNFLSLLEHVEKWQQKSGNKPITVHCSDGAERSGVYCAVASVIDKMKVEQSVDVFYIVKQQRIRRPQFITNLEQYKFCHDCALEYLESFEMYSNFK
ncbi:PREDICTED: receptor-type tyrosine-protein phosphatase kappa-like [Priapulus caudatus]|uniref:Receptor-type tyrosine-protein phosphatase kappa-like n=1 Tax=Priapulus caudatus TaxID=37621 RepID=A0ABM1EIX1_PRICU|nr:PREDICTED: receptor-type tyrosine-protein phosphatase kappa-like [Priapulus caudatus]